MAENNIPLELIEQVARDNCALFIGTGPAVYGEYGLDVKDLVAELIRYGEFGTPKQGLAKVAEYYELAVDRPSLVTKVSDWIEAKTHSPSTLDQTLARLPFRYVVTTRTDLMLEEAYRKAGKTVVKVVRDAEVALGDSQKVLLVKMHGSIDQKDALAITDQDYALLLKKRPLLSDFVKLLFAVKTVLFVGHDLDDYYSRQLHHEILHEMGGFSRKAYAIWEGVTSFSAKYWENNNVKLIDSNTTEFLRGLEQKLSSYKPENQTLKTAKTKRQHTAPYKFLEYFESADVDLFFGRRQETRLLSQRILAHRLVVLYGKSGVGKTSLIKAGVISELGNYETFNIYSRCLDAPISAVEKAIGDTLILETGWAKAVSGEDENRLISLLTYCQQATGKRVVLIVDQLEELFQLPYEIQQSFIKQLAMCVNERTRLDIRVVLSVRDDFFAELDNFKEYLPHIFTNVFRLQDLSESAAVEAIVQPLGYFKAKYEDELVELLIKDLRTEGAIAPAQLQIVCSRLYEKFAGKINITVEDYRSLGEARVILGVYLGEVLEKLNRPSRKVAQQILQALVSSRKSKKILSEADIARSLNSEWKQIEKIVSTLEDYRLIRKVETDEGYRYELVHEYLVQQVWQWLSEEDAKVKEVQEILDTETMYWPKYRSPISRQKLDVIYDCWNSLVLGEEHLELLFRSSVAFGYVKQWNQTAGKLSEELIPLYIKLLSDEDIEVVRLASLALAKLGAMEKLNQALTSVDGYRQSYARKALRQLEEGRSDEDFAAELSGQEWSEKSLWNTSSIVGIDFGTTASAIAVIRNNKPIIIPNKEGSKFTPSIVSITDNGEVVVGTPAALQAATNPDRTVFSVKRQLGTDWKVSFGTKIYTAVDIVSFILMSLKQEAESYLEREVSKAVIGVPAYFNNTQRQALLQAAQRAGLEVFRLIAEPTAASLAYGLNTKYDELVAVYDLGGGTFDISLLELGEGVAEVKAVNGDTNLGGNDFDARIINYLIEVFREKHGIDLSSDKVARIRLKEEAERAKIALSGFEKVNIYIPYIYADKQGIKHLDAELSRSKFEELTKDLVEKTLSCCKAAVTDAGLTNQLQNVELVLVGLSTKIPLVRDSISNFFKKEPRRGVDPDEAVALGLAIEAGVLSGMVTDQLLLDVNPLSLGIETLGGVFTTFIPRNSTLPTRKTEIFSTASDNQTSVEVGFAHKVGSVPGLK